MPALRHDHDTGQLLRVLRWLRAAGWDATADHLWWRHADGTHLRYDRDLGVLVIDRPVGRSVIATVDTAEAVRVLAAVRIVPTDLVGAR
jgi:phage baseplate assembly protein gpV